jgi:hypothetical protein
MTARTEKRKDKREDVPVLSTCSRLANGYKVVGILAGMSASSDVDFGVMERHWRSEQ